MVADISFVVSSKTLVGSTELRMLFDPGVGGPKNRIKLVAMIGKCITERREWLNN